MIYLGIIILILIITFLLYILIRFFDSEIKELEERILQLEERLEEYKRENKKEVKAINTALHNLNGSMNKNYLEFHKELKKKGDK